MLGKSLGKRYDAWYSLFGVHAHIRHVRQNCIQNMKVIEKRLKLKKKYCKRTIAFSELFSQNECSKNLTNFLEFLKFWTSVVRYFCKLKTSQSIVWNIKVKRTVKVFNKGYSEYISSQVKLVSSTKMSKIWFGRIATLIPAKTLL